MTDTAEHTDPQPSDADIDTVTHPSGWWKKINGQWRPADPAATDDLTLAMTLAVGAVVIGSLLPWAQMLHVSIRGTDGDGNLTLLLGGVAGALTARWRIGGSTDRRLITWSLVLCATTSAVLLHELVNVTSGSVAAQPQGGLFLATAGALFATGLALVLRQRTGYEVRADRQPAWSHSASSGSATSRNRVS